MSYKLDYSRSGGGNGSTKIPLEDLHRDWHPVFLRFKPDRNGEVKISEMRRLLQAPEIQNEIPSDAMDNLLLRMDQDGNKRISYREFLEMVRGHDLEPSQRPIIRKALYAAAYTVVPRNERDYLSQYSCTPPPLFMLTISLVELGIFIYHTVHLVQKHGWVGVNGPVPFDSKLIFDPYRRYEAWRFLTYMLVHAGIMHLAVNVLVQLFLGIPLEMVHKWWRVLIVYMAGVLAGSLATSITEPRIFLVGASGGVYAIMFAHLASVIMNWKEMEFAWFRLISFIILIGSDVGVAIYSRYFQGENNIGYVAHLAGAVAGLLIGINVLRNLRQRSWEKVVWWTSLTIYILLMAAAIAYNIFNPFGRIPPQKYGNDTFPF